MYFLGRDHGCWSFSWWYSFVAVGPIILCPLISQSLTELTCTYDTENQTRYLSCDLGNPMKAGTSVCTLLSFGGIFSLVRSMTDMFKRLGVAVNSWHWGCRDILVLMIMHRLYHFANDTAPGIPTPWYCNNIVIEKYFCCEYLILWQP